MNFIYLATGAIIAAFIFLLYLRAKKTVRIPGMNITITETSRIQKMQAENEMLRVEYESATASHTSLYIVIGVLFLITVVLVYLYVKKIFAK